MNENKLIGRYLADSWHHEGNKDPFKYMTGSKVLNAFSGEWSRNNGDSVIIETTVGMVAIGVPDDCCNGGSLEEVQGGDLADLVGQTINLFEETDCTRDGDSFGGGVTTVFYKINNLSIRFCGSSNGYYAEKATVEFHPLRSYED